MDTEAHVARQYSHGRLESAILDALRAAGKRPDALTTTDLSAIDELHLGGRTATVELARDIGLCPGLELFDIGAGLGGPARHFAEAHGCKVLGIDLNEEYVEVANALSSRCCLDDRVRFFQASALATPFPSERFDVATLLHVGMNIADKAALVAEVRRVLKPGGRFVVYDVMRLDNSTLPYPLPWSDGPGTSFVETPDTYRRLLETHGFGIERQRNQRDQALELGHTLRAHAAAHGVPPLGLHVVMGPTTPLRLANVMSMLERGSIAPIEIVARASLVRVSSAPQASARRAS
jgi:ubiquinone/menaquinone biosynthesis C-methylase UbiE